MEPNPSPGKKNKPANSQVQLKELIDPVTKSPILPRLSRCLPRLVMPIIAPFGVQLFLWPRVCFCEENVAYLQKSISVVTMGHSGGWWWYHTDTCDPNLFPLVKPTSSCGSLGGRNKLFPEDFSVIY